MARLFQRYPKYLFMKSSRPTGPLNDTEIERMEGAEGTPSKASLNTPDPHAEMVQSPYAGPRDLDDAGDDEDEGEEDDLILGDEDEAVGDEEEFEVELEEDGAEGDYDEDDLVIDDEEAEDEEL